MKEYPIFKHLIQFSNLVDSEGNFVAGAEIEAKASGGLHEELKRSEQYDKSDDSDKEGGDLESRGVYEGGDDNEENPNKNGTGLNS